MPNGALTTIPLARIFWTLLAIEVVAFEVVMILAATAGGQSPEGPVGAWIVILPPLVWALLAYLFSRSDSPAKRLTYTVLLALPLILLVVGPVYQHIQLAMWERGWRGADYFSGAQLALANAIYDHDAERVTQLLPQAGDLNKPYHDMTLFEFAMNNADETDASFEIVRAMLAAGGNPNVPPRIPLLSALYRGPRFAQLLLDAGADPNALDEAGRPIWWTVLSAASDRGLTLLTLLLARGAGLKQRDREGGPVAWAAYHKAWRAMWFLMERGADWKNEQAFGQPVARMLAMELEYNKQGAPEEVHKALAKYEAAAKEH